MTEPFDPLTVPIADAATVMLVRDGAYGLEVFMLRRTTAAVFAGGMFVFPGGRVDLADATPEIAAVCDGFDDAAASARLGVPSGGLAFWVGAIRECFEEAGVLLASDASGSTVSFEEPSVAERFEVDRHLVHDGTLGLAELCRREGLRLRPAEIEYVAHWLTPIGERRRFDTRFFLARAPKGQVPLHDDGETIESMWVRPSEALAANRRGELTLMPPTFANLQFLAACGSADDALVAARAIGRPARIMPKTRISSAGKMLGLVLPGEAGFDEMPDYEIV